MASPLQGAGWNISIRRGGSQAPEFGGERAEPGPRVLGEGAGPGPRVRRGLSAGAQPGVRGGGARPRWGAGAAGRQAEAGGLSSRGARSRTGACHCPAPRHAPPPKPSRRGLTAWPGGTAAGGSGAFPGRGRARPWHEAAGPGRARLARGARGAAGRDVPNRLVLLLSPLRGPGVGPASPRSAERGQLAAQVRAPRRRPHVPRPLPRALPRRGDAAGGRGPVLPDAAAGLALGAAGLQLGQRHLRARLRAALRPGLSGRHGLRRVLLRALPARRPRRHAHGAARAAPHPGLRVLRLGGRLLLLPLRPVPAGPRDPGALLGAGEAGLPASGQDPGQPSRSTPAPEHHLLPLLCQSYCR